MAIVSQDDDKRNKFLKFVERVSDCELPDKRDIYLKRWLIARNYDIDQAEKMLRTSLEWRKKHNADNLLDVWPYPEVARKYYSFGKLGTDKFGCPLWMTGQGMIDWKGFHLSLCKRDIIKFLICNTEMMARDIDEECRRTGKETTFITLIFDMDKLSMRQVAHKQTMDTAREMVHMFEANYPESLRRVFIINAPKLFSLAFNMIKPFMQQNTLDKLKFFGHNKEEWTAAMLEEIDADQLPVLYGGTMTDPDGNPNCPSRFNLGGEIPSTYYMCNNKPIWKENMEKAVLIAGASGMKKLKFQVDVLNSVLRWEFFTEGGDIRFRVYLKNNNDEKVDLVPLVRVESHLVTEEGYVTCDQIGQYVVLFDNSFSYFRQKKLNYRVFVEPHESKCEP